VNLASTSTCCPVCKSTDMRETTESETFPYGENGVEIMASVPVLRCEHCGFSYTDHRAEKLRHAAVCAHMGLLSPEEMRHIRKTVLDMSRDAFHAAYGLSPASVERWENGKLFQNEAADTLIRALQDPAVARRLDRRPVRAAAVESAVQDNVIWGRFPSLERSPLRAEDALVRSRNFNLRIQVG
jgi:putative zinc finger/helix-turn-helix YgiT family protein